MPDNAKLRLAMALQALGNNAEDVGHLLEYGGWRGLPRDLHACPVALYLRTVVNDVTDAEVSTTKARIHSSDGSTTTVDLPPAVAGFVIAFDAETFPRLIVTATDANGDVIDELDR